MRFINKIRENYHYWRSQVYYKRMVKNQDNKNIWSRWMGIFAKHWEKYNDLLSKRLGIL